MSRKRDQSGGTPKLDIQRIRVNRDGYDDTGACWGAGHDVILTTPDGSEEITVRARTIKEARQKADAELKRPAGQEAKCPCFPNALTQLKKAAVRLVQSVSYTLRRGEYRP